MDLSTSCPGITQSLRPVAEGREERFRDLVQRHSADLYRYARWLGADAALAEDLVQDVFLRAWNALESLRDVNAAKSWLITILRRENARRFERYRPPESDVELDELPGETVACDTSTEAIVLRRAMAELPEAYREPLLLQVLWGYSCQEIADMLELSPAAVMTRLFRARERLRAVLDEHGHGPHG